MAQGQGEDKASPRRISATEKQRQALELRKAGANYRQIQQSLGYRSVSGAYKAVQSALQKMLQDPAEEVRKLEVDRLDALLMATWPAAMAGELPAVDRVLNIMARRAALLGLDAPKQVDLSVYLIERAKQYAADWGLSEEEAVATAEAIIAEHQR